MENEQQTLVEQIASRRGAMNLSDLTPILNIDYTTLCEWAKKGILPAYKLGNRWRVDPVIFSRWLESRDHSRSNESGPNARLRSRRPLAKPSGQGTASLSYGGRRKPALPSEPKSS